MRRQIAVNHYHGKLTENGTHDRDQYIYVANGHAVDKLDSLQTTRFRA
jgi:hypothetical protein